LWTLPGKVVARRLRSASTILPDGAIDRAAESDAKGQHLGFERISRFRPGDEASVANIDELEIELRVIGKTADAGRSGPYDSFLASAGSAEALEDDIARHKGAHLADIYAPKRNGR
jgi:hypothetical protein